MVHWNDANENLLKQWGERSSVLRILHNKASRSYKRGAMLLTLPIIVVSTIAASLQLRLSNEDKVDVQLEVFVASINILIAVMTGIASMLKWQERSEAHKTSSSGFGNYYRQISCELSFPRDERDPPSDILRAMKKQYDMLLEASPDIPQHMISKFKKTYSDSEMTISLPDVCNGLDPIRVCKSDSYADVV